MPDFYEVLGVSRDASDETIHSVYRRLAQIYHPDVNADNAAGGAKLAAINEAYATLSDPSRRAGYDARLRAAAGGVWPPPGPAPSAAPAAARPTMQSHGPAPANRRALWIALGTLCGLLVVLFVGGWLLTHQHHAAVPQTLTGVNSPKPLATKAAAFGHTVALRDSFGATLDVTPLAVKALPSAIDQDGDHDIVAIELRLKDAGSATISDDASEGLQMRDSAGAWHEAERPGVPHELDSFTLRPGRTVRGWVCFALPKGTRVAELAFTPGSQLSDASGDWLVPAGSERSPQPSGSATPGA
jgi:hypothetical protein